MFEQERRRAERLLLVPPIDARVQNHPVRLVDIGVLGTRVEHEQPLVAGGPQKLCFRWDGEEVEVDCTVVHSEFAGGRFSSGLSFTGTEPRSLAPGDRLPRPIATRWIACARWSKRRS